MSAKTGLFCTLCKEELPPAHLSLGDDFRIHSECFCCNVCKLSLQGQQIFSEGGRLLCKEHAQTFLIKCDGCKQNITTGSIYKVADKNYHPKCLKCYICFEQFLDGEGMDVSPSGHPVCYSCSELKCEICNLQVDNDCVVFRNKKIHRNCHKCIECGKTFKDNENAVDHQGKTFCVEHYYGLNPEVDPKKDEAVAREETTLVTPDFAIAKPTVPVDEPIVVSAVDHVNGLSLLSEAEMAAEDLEKDLPYVMLGPEKLSSNERELLLWGNSKGTFIITGSENTRRDYNISFMGIGKVEHYMINSVGRQYCIDGKFVLKDGLSDLVSYYQQKPISEDVLLTGPPKKEKPVVIDPAQKKEEIMRAELLRELDDPETERKVKANEVMLTQAEKIMKNCDVPEVIEMATMINNKAESSLILCDLRMEDEHVDDKDKFDGADLFAEAVIVQKIESNLEEKTAVEINMDEETETEAETEAETDFEDTPTDIEETEDEEDEGYQDEKRDIDILLAGLVKSQKPYNVEKDKVISGMLKEYWAKFGVKSMSRQKLIDTLSDIVPYEPIGIERQLRTLKISTKKEMHYKEFIKCYNSLMNFPAFLHLFKSLSSKKNLMLKRDLMFYLRSCQDIPKESAQEILGLLDIYCPMKPMISKDMNAFGPLFGVHDKSLTYSGFVFFALSQQNYIYDPKKKTLYQDMNQPLSAYYVNSSHNTYLEGDQLRSPSTAAAYAKTLQAGCRCVELDLWNGPGNDPVIYHGHTLTPKVKAREVLIAIAENAFVASPYPLVLSLENHLKNSQEEVFVAMAKEIFGSKVPTCAVRYWEKNPTELPSPESLKYNIIIKHKAHSKRGGEAESKDAEPVLPVPQEKKVLQRSSSLTPEGSDAETKKFEKRMSLRSKRSSLRRAGTLRKSKTPAPMSKEREAEEKKKKMAVTQAMSDYVVYCKAVSFQTFDREYKCYEMSSFNEKKGMKIVRKENKQIVDFSTNCFARIYPDGFRFDSSNYDPIPFWNSGCQMVALNYQTPDRVMQLNYGRFQENNNSGYVLKPAFLRKNKGNVECARPFTLKITIFHAILSQPKTSKQNLAVEVEMAGVTSSRYCTAGTTAPAMPTWLETFEFEVSSPELALMRFALIDKSNNNNLVGQYVVPVTCLQSGVRLIPLETMTGFSVVKPTGSVLSVCVTKISNDEEEDL